MIIVVADSHPQSSLQLLPPCFYVLMQSPPFRHRARSSVIYVGGDAQLWVFVHVCAHECGVQGYSQVCTSQRFLKTVSTHQVG